jgi:CDP-glucose 4,6-dehydratase
MSDFWNGRRVLITGVSGFLGGWLAKMLLAEGADLVGYDLSTRGCLRAHRLEGIFPIVQGSVLDPTKLEQALQDHCVEVCFHLAGQSMIEDAAAGPLAALEVNISGTWLVLEACRRAGGIIGVACASSNHTYGPQQAHPFAEDFALNQVDIYGASKSCADILARTYSHEFDMPVVAVRNTNSFGGGDPHVSHIVTGTVLSLLEGKAPVIRSDGSPIKAYIHAEDTMAAYMLLAEHAGQAGVKGEAFNVTPDEPISVLDLVKMVVKVSGKADLLPVVLSTDLSQKDYFEHLSNEKIKRVLGWQPRYTLEQGLRKTYEWYAEHGLGWLH